MSPFAVGPARTATPRYFPTAIQHTSMGRTLLGIDLDESQVGGLIEGLLAEDDLEKLADGGTEDDRESDGDERAASPAGRADTGPTGFESETPSPGAEPVEPAGGGGSDEDDGGGILARLRPHLKKIGIAVAVLGVLAVVAWKFGGRIAGAVKSRLGRGDDGNGSDGDAPGVAVGPPTGEREDVPSARQRAKATEDPEEPEDREPDEVRRPTEPDADLGALVGLAALALIAAVVRKFGEGRPYDPLVDGPAPGSAGADGRDDAGDGS